MRNPSAETGPLHRIFIDVIGREIPGDPGKEIDIRLADSFSEMR